MIPTPIHTYADVVSSDPWRLLFSGGTVSQPGRACNTFVIPATMESFLFLLSHFARFSVSASACLCACLVLGSGSPFPCTFHENPSPLYDHIIPRLRTPSPPPTYPEISNPKP